jgi:hypothetical protein
LGKPRRSEHDRYTKRQVEGIEVYFPPNLEVHEDSRQIRLKLRSFIFFRWLKLEGAKPIAFCDFVQPEQPA